MNTDTAPICLLDRIRVHPCPSVVKSPTSILMRSLLTAAVLSFLALHPSLAHAAITLEETTDHGQAAWRIATPAATWVYHLEGAGFSSLFDPAGRDWLAYRPTGGAAGHYRGIPNAVFRRDQAGNNFFHPGHTGPKASRTTLISSSPDRVVFASRSNDDRWACEWEIRPDRAVLRFTQLPPDDNGYWFLYEGTPGGRFESTDLCLRADGTITPLSETWEASMSDIPWVAFISPERGALILIAHDAPASRVSYRPMEDAMTVFGFGREHRSLANLLTRPLTFTVALVAETDPAKIAERVAALQR